MAFTTLKLLNHQTLICRRLFFNTCQKYEKTASIIVIGDEILKGMVADTNSHFITKTLRSIGVTTRKIVVIGDLIDDAAGEIKQHSEKYDYVITSGGIGPTHDDITYEAVAKAFNDSLAIHPILEKIVMDFFITRHIKHPSLKLANVPKSAKITFGLSKEGKKLRYPIVSVQNVFTFPGVPQLLEKSFEGLARVLFSSNEKFYLKVVYLNVQEYAIVSQLNYVVKEFPSVMFGSYPEWSNEKYKVKITIESTNESLTQDAYKKFISLLPSDAVVEG